MTRKDYVLIARAIKLATEDWQECRRIVAETMADELEADNARFNRGTFMTACGVAGWSV